MFAFVLKKKKKKKKVGVLFFAAFRYTTSVFIVSGERFAIPRSSEIRTRPRRYWQGSRRNESRFLGSRIFGSIDEYLLHRGAVRRHEIRRARAENRKQLQGLPVSSKRL